MQKSLYYQENEENENISNYQEITYNIIKKELEINECETPIKSLLN